MDDLEAEALDLVQDLRAYFSVALENGHMEWPVSGHTAESLSASKPVIVEEIDREVSVDSAPDGSQSTASEIPEISVSKLSLVRTKIGDCKRCDLHKGRKNIVFGVGSEHAEVMFIGDAPGVDEDANGEPFVGKAGQLLDKMIVAMKLKRQDVYIANVLKCQTPGQRDPGPDEISECKGFLEEQIRAVSPKIIVTLGKSSAQLVLDTKAPISVLRGHWHRAFDAQVMPTLHPATLLEDPRKKKEAWSDLQAVMSLLASSS